VKLTVPTKLLLTYLLAASALTLLIIGALQKEDEAMLLRLKKLSIEVEGLDRSFCERINQMHRARGFEVIDCLTKTVIIAEDDNVPF